MQNLKFLSVFAFVSALLTVAFGYFYMNEKREADRIADVPVVLKGEDENNYPATILLYGVDAAGQGNICGGTIISDGVAVTAAHCVDKVKNAYINPGDYNPDGKDLVKIEEIYLNRNWDPSFSAKENFSINNIKYDFAILTFSPDALNLRSAKPSSPSTTCGYKVTGYGLRYGETAVDLTDGREKESIDVCISDKTQELIVLSPEKGTGICFGDSGSPVYKTDTNEIIGVISSIFSNDFAAKTPCHLDNVAVAVRIDAFEDVLASFYEPVVSENNSNDYYDFNDNFDSEYDDSLGDSFDNLDDKTKDSYDQHLDSDFGWDKFREKYGLEEDDAVDYFKDDELGHDVPPSSDLKNDVASLQASMLLIVFICFCCFTLFIVLIIVVIVVASRRKKQNTLPQ